MSHGYNRLQELARDRFSWKPLYLVGVALELGKLFLPAVAAIYPHLHWIFLGEAMGLVWLFLVIVLIASLVDIHCLTENRSEQLFIGLQLLVGIIAYRTDLSMWGILGYTVVATVLIASIWWRVFEDTIQQSIRKAASFTAIALIFGLTWNLVASYVLLPELVLTVVGVMILLQWFFGRIHRVPDTVGIGDRLYKSSLQLLSTSTGVATAAIIYFALFSAKPLIEAYQVPMFLDEPFLNSIEGVAVNVAGFYASIFYFTLIFLFWFKVLQRAPYSVQYWENGFDQQLHRRLPPRPGISLIVFPVVGWVLSRLPTWEVARFGKYANFAWSDSILLGFIVVQACVFLLTVWVWFPWHRFGGGSRSSSGASVKGDHLVFLVAIPCLAVIHIPLSSFTVLFIASYGVLLAAEYWFESDSKIVRVVAAVEVFLIGGPLVWFYELEGVAFQFWRITLVFFFAYLLLQVAEAVEGRSAPLITVDRWTDTVDGGSDSQNESLRSPPTGF